MKIAYNKQFCCHLGNKARAWVQKERTWENNVRQVIKMASGLIEKRRADEFQKKMPMS